MGISRIKNAAGYMYYPDHLPIYHEQAEIEFLKKQLRPGMRVIDIGAAYGLYSVCCAHHAGAQVIAIEMDSEVCAILGKTVNTFYPGKIEIHNVAAWYEDTEVGIKEWEISDKLKCNRVDESGKGIKAVRLDDYLDIYPFDFIKIDTESAEILVLEGMVEIIKNSPRLLLMLEIVPASLRQYGDSVTELVKFLEDILGLAYIDHGQGGFEDRLATGKVFNAFYG